MGVINVGCMAGFVWGVTCGEHLACVGELRAEVGKGIDTGKSVECPTQI